MTDTPRKPVSASDWKSLPLPDRRARLALSRILFEDQLALIRLGFKPESQDDRWFMYYQDYRLYIHRSWTGHCIYIAYFRLEKDLWILTHADVNRDPQQYTQTDDESDARALAALVDGFLLGEPRDYINEAIPADVRPYFVWSFMGRLSPMARLGLLCLDLRALCDLLALDPACPWQAHFEQCWQSADDLRRRGAPPDQLAGLARQVMSVYKGAGSFNDYAPPAAQAGMADFSACATRVFERGRDLLGLQNS